MRRVVEPTPPAGVPGGLARGDAPAAGFAGAVMSPAAMSERGGAANVCPRCQTRNPPAGKFCVSCGAGLGDAAAPAPSPQPQPVAVPDLVPAPQPERAQEAVKPSAVLNVASERPRTTTIICDRCQGVCESGMRFCKFCGAPLPQADGVRQQALAAPAADPGSRQSDYAKAATRQGLQAAIEEAARQAASLSPKTVGQPVPLAPTAQGDVKPSLRSRTDPATPEAIDPGRKDWSQPDPGQAAPTAGLYAPTSLRGAQPSGRLIVIAGDGQEGPSFSLVGEQMDIGQSEGTVVLPEDRYMSPRHARLVRIKGRWYVRDLGSTNGVFVRISAPHELVDSDSVLLGVEVLRFEMIGDAESGLGPAVQHGTLVFGSPALPRPARLVQRTVEGVARDVYHLHRLETVIGRESGDIVFTDDPYLSRRHALVRRDSATGRFTLIDLDSSNGTFVAIRGDCPVGHGDSIRVGQHLFRIELTQG